MLNNIIYYLNNNKILTKLLFFSSILFVLGIPIISWISFLLVSFGILILFYGKIYIVKIKFICILIILFTSVMIKGINSYSIDQGFLIYPTHENQYLETILPSAINDFVKKIIKDNYDVRIPKSENGWSFSADGIWQNKKLSRKINNIEFTNINEERVGTYNNVLMQINHNNWDPYSLKLPLVIKYILPTNYIDSEICFSGLLFINNEFQKHQTKECTKIHKNSLEFYAFDIETLPNLSIETKSNKLIIKYSFILDYFSYGFAFLIILLLVKISFIPISFLILGFINYFIFLIDLVFKENLPSKFSTFIYMGRGNDGLMHYGYGREIAKYLSEGNLFMAFRGGVDVFHWMPGLRYFYSLTFFLFGETILGYLLIGLFFPFLILNLLNKFFSKKISFVLIYVFLVFPIFESYGFFNFYYMKLIAKGFGGTLGWFCFIASINLLLINMNPISFKSFYNNLFSGILLTVLISCRPNLIPTVFILYIGFLILYIAKKNIISFLGLLIGSSSFFLFLFHNYYFGSEFALITNSASTLRNMPIPPYLWLDFFATLGQFSLDIDLLKKLLIHISIWINYYEIWLMICIVSLIAIIFKKSISLKIKIVSIALIFGHSIYIFYAGVPRYTYGLWMMSFILMLIYFNNTFHMIRLYNFIKLKIFKKSYY